MGKSFYFLSAVLVTVLISVSSWAQSVTISGTVRNISTKERVPAVSVIVKSTKEGTFTDDNGKFTLVVPGLPVDLIFSSVGFETKEIAVTEASTSLEVDFVPGSSLGQEVVVSASRLPERILESGVSIERVNAQAIRNLAAPSYYEGLMNLKGVDMTTSGLLFRTLSTRGFNGSGNLRFNQLVDGMDNQAPGLNFSVGNIVGVTELDVDNMELLQGASSALYGSGGVNGTLLISSKNPFQHQGLSLQVKQGIMHVDERQRPASPYYDWSLRYGRKIGEKFAFKITAQYIKANDWQAQDTRNLLRENVNSKLTGGNRQSDPNYDGVNVFGDEASTNMHSVAQAARAQVAANPSAAPALSALSGMIAGGFTPQQIANAFATNPALASLVQYLPFLIPTSPVPVGSNPYAATFYTGTRAQFVSRTGYDEKYLVDYNTYNVKLGSGLYYKLTDNVEASVLGYWGTGTTVYTGADRYSIKNLLMGQYKAEVKGKNWFLRGNTTQENSGDSYTATTAALYINNSWKSNTNWFQQYSAIYSAARLGIIPASQAPPYTFAPSMNNDAAHFAARSTADQGRFLPGSFSFDTAFKNAVNKSIGKGGAKFEDASDLYHFEGQYNFAEHIQFAEVLIGASYRIYSLNSKGTIFADTTGRINISEVGSYIQVQKKLLKDVLKLTGSARYDKNENFEGRFTPRGTALIKVAQDNNIRLSYQTAYRFPSTQDQYINLLTGGANRLIGGLPQFNTFFKFNSNPGYTSESVVAYRNSGNPAVLQKAQFQTIKPEVVNSYEVGYRGLVTKQLLIDAYGYYSRYKDFIVYQAVGRGKSGDPSRAPIDLASPFTTDNYRFVANTPNEVSAIGWGFSLNYLIGKGYELSGNISSDKLRDVPTGYISYFNTPKFRFNAGVSNNKLGKHWGFNIIYKWQDEVLWEGTFGTGPVPAYGALDAQVTYRMPKIKSLIKVGGSNITNEYYYSAFGNPQIGGAYYISLGYNIF